MGRPSSSTTRILIGVGALAVVAVVLVVVIVTSGGTSAGVKPPTTLSASASVLDAGYARHIGFPKTVQAAKRTSVTEQKGCSSSVDAVYEDAGSKTGLISDVLNCDSESSASAALAAARKHAVVDSSLAVPKQLGAAAFATDNGGPEYLLVWQAGTRVAIEAIDVDIAASASSTSKSPAAPLTPSQDKTLVTAALEQNSLYQ
ncbi:MAG: hypothetical protein ABSF33_11085 [Acidimicrobiales bacterium]|jgi:hypothetical protein